MMETRLTLKHGIALRLRRLRYGTPDCKVFGVGFQKTGTTSLQYALSLLGYRVGGVFRIKDLGGEPGIRRKVMELSEHFDAAADHPWPIFYRELDEKFPGSKFILTTRDSEKWYKSVCGHFADTEDLMRTWIYGPGAPTQNRERYVDRLLSHENDVRAHFADRPGQLLEMDLSKGHGWPELCAFLGKPVPRRPFPRLNTAQARAS